MLKNWISAVGNKYFCFSLVFDVWIDCAFCVNANLLILYTVGLHSGFTMSCDGCAISNSSFTIYCAGCIITLQHNGGVLCNS